LAFPFGRRLFPIFQYFGHGFIFGFECIPEATGTSASPLIASRSKQCSDLAPRRDETLCTSGTSRAPRLGGSLGRGLLGRALQKAVQAGAPNAQHLRRAHSISVAHIQHTLNVHAAYFVEWQRLPV